MPRKPKTHRLNQVKWTDIRETEDWKELRDREVENQVDLKIKGALFKPKTKNQEVLFKYIDEGEIILVEGPAGSGKSALTCSKAVEQLIDGRVDKLIISRPLVQCSENIGLLPGNVREKVEGYLAPILGYLNQFLGKQQVEKLFNDEVLQIVPLALMRGYTFHKSFCIIDECQNTTKDQLKMILTRLGNESKMVFLGDTEQSDLGLKKGEKTGFEKVIDELEGIDNKIKIVQLDDCDILRNPLIKKILNALS